MKFSTVLILILMTLHLAKSHSYANSTIHAKAFRASRLPPDISMDSTIREIRKERAKMHPLLKLCQKNILQYSYDPVEKHCFAFMYNGCGSKYKRYMTYEECRWECTEVDRY